MTTFSDVGLMLLRHPRPSTAAVQRVRDSLVEERSRLAAGLAAVPYLEPYPSAANFVLCRVGGDRDAGQLRDALAQRHGIMARPPFCPTLTREP